ncbi:hypothetical protein L2D00_10195 [Hyphomonadaceae bacterium BL14]|nr:hypothetical protein L2D00_10195 [Hyphomonadaceae bacterium BL14]
MTKLARMSAFASAAALALALAACGAEETGEGPRTEVTEAQIEEGLDALGFARSDLFAASEAGIENGVAVYTGLTSADGEAAGRIGRVSIGAPRVEDGVTRFDWLEAEDLLAGGEDGDGIARVARLRADRPGAALSQAIADLINGRTDADGYTLPSRNGADYTFDELSLSGLSFTANEENEDPVGGTLARAALEAFDGERLGRAVIEGLSITGDDADAGALVLRLDEFALTGLDALFVDVLLNLDGDGQVRTGFDGPFGDAMASMMRPTGAFESIAVRGMEVRAAGARIGMPTLDMRYETRRDDSVDIIAEMPQLTVALSSDTPETAQAAQMLASMGYEALEFSLYSRSRYDPATDRATVALEDYRFELKDGLRLSMAQDVTGLQAYADATAAVMTEMMAAMEDNPDAPDTIMNERLMEAYGALQIHSMTLRIDDLNLLERVMTLNAQTQGVTPEQARMQAATMMGLGIAMGGGMLPEGLAIELGAALSAFINQGGAVEINLNPAAPVGMDRLMNVAEDMSVLRELGLTVRHIPAE